MTQMLPKRAQWTRRLAVMVFVLPLAPFWGEFFTRMLLPQNVDSNINAIIVTDPRIGFKYVPGGKTYEKGREYNVPYEINSFGLRDREYGQNC
jgi:hypothetical protein